MNYDEELYGANDFRNYGLAHHGILGQKWGVRRYQNSDGSLTEAGKTRYSSTSIRAALARRSNEKVDEGFKKWKEGSSQRENAVDLGKKANVAKMAYSKDPSKENKAAYKQANREYKKALRDNTTYRKGQVKQQVESDLSRKYLSEAKKVKKLLDQDPQNKELNKQYAELMSQHDIYRASARRAPEVAAARSQKQASIKRGITNTTKVVATTAMIGIGAYMVNDILEEHGSSIHINGADVDKFVKAGRAAANAARYIYF